MSPTPRTLSVPGVLWWAASPLVLTVDRIEGPVAIVEWSTDLHIEVPVSLLPPGVHEGDQLRLRRRRPTRPSRGPAPPETDLPDDLFTEAPRGVVPPPPSHAPNCAHTEFSC